MLSKKYLDELTYSIIGAVIEVHKELGPGLLESIYHSCLAFEFAKQGIEFESELPIEVNYKGNIVKTNLRCDFLVEDAIIVELKSVAEILPVHKAQPLTYMKLRKKPKGILINFNVNNIFKEGQQTFVNDYFTMLD